MTSQIPLMDAFHRELNIGDLVLGAKGRPNHFIATVFTHAIVIGRTKAMVRLHQVNSYGLTDTKEILQSIEGRYGRGGGKINPNEVILVNAGHLSPQVIEDTLAKGKTNLTVQAPIALFCTNTLLTPAPAMKFGGQHTHPTSKGNP